MCETLGWESKLQHFGSGASPKEKMTNAACITGEEKQEKRMKKFTDEMILKEI